VGVDFHLTNVQTLTSASASLSIGLFTVAGNTAVFWSRVTYLSNPSDDHNILHPHALAPMNVKMTTTKKKSFIYSPVYPPSLSMSELVYETLDHDATDVLIDKWLEHRNDAY